MAWDDVCKPSDKRGLGVRSVDMAYSASLAKLGWKVMQDEAGLWGELLKAKYYKGVNPMHHKKKVTDSYTPRSIAHGLQVVKRGLSWTIANGRSVYFWVDTWAGDTSLEQLALEPISEEEKKLVVANFLREDGRWNWEKFMMIAATDITFSTGEDDPMV